MIDHDTEVKKWLVELVTDGWIPICSGDGGYLYLKKDDSYNPPIPGDLLIGACKLIDEDFWLRVNRKNLSR